MTFRLRRKHNVVFIDVISLKFNQHIDDSYIKLYNSSQRYRQWLQIIIPSLASTGGWSLKNWCRLPYTCEIDSDLNSSDINTIIPHGQAAARIPKEYG